MTRTIEDKELGIITIRTNPNAKRYTLRIKDGAVFGTMPPRGSMKTMTTFIENSRQRLIVALQRFPTQKNLLDDAIELQTNTFKINIFRADRSNYYLNLKDGILHIACPKNTDFTDEQVQNILKQLLEKTLRHEAKRILPVRLHTLAEEYGFTYSEVKINNSKTRWGSCSARKNINLSLSLMLLPDHLINYVLLHELCHTQEMSHSDRFWHLMDSVTNNKASALRKELKSHRTL